MTLSPKSGQRVLWTLLILVLAYGLYQAIALAWVCDDAFISFRYAQNLIHGNGLVYNVGERVEGYTNFLWTVVIAGGMWAGFDPVSLSQILGLVFFLLTAAVLIYLSFRLAPSEHGQRVVMPMAAMAILLLHECQVWATSGLETSSVTFLIVLGFALLVLGDSVRSTLAAGCVMTAAALSRPDAMIFCAMAVPYLFLFAKPRFQRIAVYLIPLVVIFVPFWLIRYQYYGYPFPNTFYAKSVALSNFGQGLIHLWLYIKTYYVLLLVPLALGAYLTGLIRLRRNRTDTDGHIERALVLGFLVVIPYVFYVVRTGGDFMFARFFIPVTPICFVILEAALLRLRLRPRFHVAIACVVLAGVLLRWPQFQPGNTYRDGIADEHSVYPPEMIAKARVEGALLKKYLGGKHVTVGFVGTGAMRMYYAELPTAIECHTGLTDEYIAHLPVEHRGRPGHEKPAPMDYLVRRGVNFLFTDGPGKEIESQHLRFISFGGIPAAIIVYDNAVMESLRTYADVRFMPFPDFLDRDLQQVRSLPQEQRREFFEFSKEFYFDHNTDSVHLAAVRAGL